MVELHLVITRRVSAISPNGLQIGGRFNAANLLLAVVFY